MSTTWQPLSWFIFHTLALNYNDKYQEHYKFFFESFTKIIPCKICRNHYIQNINKEKMSISDNINKDNIFNWTVDLHNSVNKLNHKKVWSYEEAKKYYLRNNFNNKALKIFVFEYVRSNFKKNPEKTQNLIKMLNALAYLYPEQEKKDRLINFKEKFILSRYTFKNWLTAFVLIIQY